MNLPAYYDAMRRAALRQLEQGETDLDPLLDAEKDNRRGITLLTRPPAQITAVIDTILADFQHAEPQQYYYPAADIHLTILSIISCYPGFSLAMIDSLEYQQLVRIILQNVRPFTITYTGLTASPGGVMVQGEPHDDSLEKLRDQLRKRFQESGLPQSIDQRYRIQTAHSTVIRFRHKMSNPSVLLALIEKYQRHFIGSFQVNTLELVFNDWYQRADNTVLLEKYALKAD